MKCVIIRHIMHIPATPLVILEVDKVLNDLCSCVLLLKKTLLTYVRLAQHKNTQNYKIICKD